MEKEWIECWCTLYMPPPIWVTGVQFPKLFPPHYPYGACSVRDIKKYFGSDIFPPCSQKQDTSLANFAFGHTMLIAWNQPRWDYLHHWQKQPVRMSGDQNTNGYWRSSGSEFLHQEKCLLTIPNPSSILSLEQNLENTNLTKAFHVNLFLLPFALKFSFQIHSLTHLVSWGHYKPFFIPYNTRFHMLPLHVEHLLHLVDSHSSIKTQLKCLYSASPPGSTDQGCVHHTSNPGLAIVNLITHLHICHPQKRLFTVIFPQSSTKPHIQ